MRFTDPRTTIHEAYAVNMRLKNAGEFGGGAPIDSSITAYRNMKVGLVVSVVEKQPAHLKALLIYLYAPDSYHTERQLEDLWEKLQEDFHRQCKGKKFTARQLSKIPTLAKRAIASFKRQQNSGRAMNTSELSKSMNISSAKVFREGMGKEYRHMLGLLDEYLIDALAPVEELIQEQKQRVRGVRLDTLRRRLEENKIPEAQSVKFANSRLGTDYQNLGSVSVAAADLIENQLVHVETMRSDNDEIRQYLFERGGKFAD